MALYSKEDISAATSTAAKNLGYPALTPEQELVVTNFVSGKDVFVSLPTGKLCNF